MPYSLKWKDELNNKLKEADEPIYTVGFSENQRVYLRLKEGYSALSMNSESTVFLIENLALQIKHQFKIEIKPIGDERC